MRNFLYQERLVISSLVILLIYIVGLYGYLERHFSPLGLLVFLSVLIASILSSVLFIKRLSFYARLSWAALAPVISSCLGLFLLAFIERTELGKTGGADTPFIDQIFVFTVMPLPLAKIWILSLLLMSFAIFDQCFLNKTKG